MLLKRAARGIFYRATFLPIKPVYSFYKRAKDKRIWEKMMKDLVGKIRMKMGRYTDSS
jgi:transposase